jgi:hypothetical protein
LRADRLVDLAALRADFRLAFLADFFRAPPPLRDRLVPPVPLLGVDSSKSKDDEEDDGG